jgi:F-type H+-transporting ATPase subunit b
MPQFHLDNFVPQLAWLAIFFAILYFGIVRLTLPKLGKTLDAREDRISGDLSTAERAKGEADALSASYAARSCRQFGNCRKGRGCGCFAGGRTFAGDD